MDRKIRDDFTRMVNHVCGEFHPRVDNEVKTQFIPVKNKNGKYTGCVVPRISIQQGQKNDSLYTYVEMLEKKKGGIVYQIMQAFKRYDKEIRV